MRREKTEGRHVLVCWRWIEAENCEGRPMFQSIGGQMRAIHKGDTLFVVATRDQELYLLGSIHVTRVGQETRKEAREDYGEFVAAGKNRSGPFRIIPLGSQKWKLRFEHSASERFRRDAKISDQVRQHRFLTPESSRLLDQLLKRRRQQQPRVLQQFRAEGGMATKALPRRERDPRVRRSALAKYGRRCMVCDVDLAEVYGDFARDCVEVHHLIQVGTRDKRGSVTTLADLIVLCPNCHRALHRYREPAAWRLFRRECEFAV